MEEEKQHPHLAKKETKKTSSPAEEVFLLHNTHNRSKELTGKSESSVSVHEHHHSTQAKTNATLTVATSTIPAMTNYNVNVQFDPAVPQAGKPNHISLIVTEQKVGEPIKHFDIIHDKLMHLIIVNKEDLSHFAHIHPKLDMETGIFHITHTFAKAGKYKKWIDVKPKDGMQQILTAFAFNVEGEPIHTPARITHEQTRVKNVVAEGQSYQVSLNCQPEQLVAGMDVKMTFEIKDANGKPITNLQPLMAAGGHCVIIDADSREFLHVHPIEEIDDAVSWRGGPSVSFLANFPKPGLYRVWGQFQHEGKLLTVYFTFEVVVA
ncbi:MAG TPA: hypothetical protein VE264_01770 [Nitrososphaera sp.]|nr:hypothetical protein [Nitrososphaera sp.]